MAKALGVASYGVLEFAVAIRTYLLLLADGGLELWAVREVAKGKDPAWLVARIVPLRFLLAVVAYFAVNGILAVIPENPNLRRILPLFAATAFLQALNLKWVFMGRSRMTSVAIGLIASQVVFSLAVFAVVRQPVDLIWVPVVWLAAELVMVAYFWRAFLADQTRWRWSFTLRDTTAMVRPALTLGTAHGLALMSYNLDSILLGLLVGPGPVGWYGAAYKPITAILALPVSYFIGLFPALSTAFSQSREVFRSTLARSLRLTAIFAMPIGVGGTLLAEPMMDFLFGPVYAVAVPAFQILSWSAVLVILRGNFRQALNAAGRQRLDLTCALAAVSVNLALNLAWIPRYRMIGAATATVLSEIVWFSIGAWLLSRHVIRLKFFHILWRPVVAAIGMGAFLLAAQPVFWMVRGALGVGVYFGLLTILGEKEMLARLPSGLRRTVAPIAG